MPRPPKAFSDTPFEVEDRFLVVDADGQHVLHGAHPTVAMMKALALCKYAIETGATEVDARVVAVSVLADTYMVLHELLSRMLLSPDPNVRERAFEAAHAYLRIGFEQDTRHTGTDVLGMKVDCKRAFDELLLAGRIK